MKKIFLILIFVLLNTINIFSNEAVRGFDDGIYYKIGNVVEYSYLNNSASLQIQSDNEDVYYAKIFDDNNPDNLLGYCWQIEGPDNANAQITLTLNKSLLKGNQLPSNFCIKRNHKGENHLIPQGNITITENNDVYIIKINSVNQFSIWGLFRQNPPVPTLTEWAAIVFCSLIAVVGAWFMYRRIL